ncbi:Bug family tripartite tricarboxylate transporter substrate binding protein [Siccirubricoccus phaeus]|uniref:Bug family tripartite tricarboxylate transporter substrate binding protein n=1 Tax=Siccirubricoccus phaeus TaxID=2595053 RepID=UPI0011F09CB2|nr:tripartite tricarboxylate transporter substrate binding protein [Siccirubricoccus phaeus]
MQRRALFATPLLAAPLLRGRPARGQSWPDRPITMVVPFAPGGSPDIAARILAPRMSELLGQPVAVENRSGAGSTIGTRSVIQARPDGNTVLMGSISIMMAPLTMDPVPFDTAASLRAISLLATVPYILVVRADAPPKNLAEFHAWAKANGAKLNYGSSGNGTPLHMGGALYSLMMGVELTHIAYRGTGPAMADLLAGQVQMVFGDLPGVMPHIRSGAVRPLASLVKHEVPELPGVPPMAGSDPKLAAYEVYTWVLLSGPKATPDVPVQRLHAAMVTAARDPALAPRLAELGFVPSLNSPPEADAFLAAEQAKWSDIIRRAGIRAEL